MVTKTKKVPQADPMPCRRKTAPKTAVKQAAKGGVKNNKGKGGKGGKC